MSLLVSHFLGFFIFAAAVSLPANAATVVDAPQETLEIEFLLTSAFTPTNPPSVSQWVLQFGDDRVDVGDVLTFRLFEDTRADEPILSSEYDGTRFQNGFLGIFGPSEHFQDLQGLLVIELYEGSVTVDRLFAETYVDGQRYLFSERIDVTLIPEPGTGFLVALGVVAVVCRRRNG